MLAHPLRALTNNRASNTQNSANLQLAWVMAHPLAAVPCACKPSGLRWGLRVLQQTVHPSSHRCLHNRFQMLAVSNIPHMQWCRLHPPGSKLALMQSDSMGSASAQKLPQCRCGDESPRAQCARGPVGGRGICWQTWNYRRRGRRWRRLGLLRLRRPRARGP